MVHATDIFYGESHMEVGDVILYEVPNFDQDFEGAELHLVDQDFYYDVLIEDTRENASLDKKFRQHAMGALQDLTQFELEGALDVDIEDVANILWNTNHHTEEDYIRGDWTAPNSPCPEDFSDISSDLNFPLFENREEIGLVEHRSSKQKRKARGATARVAASSKLICKKAAARRTRDRSLALAAESSGSSSQSSQDSSEDPENKRETHNVLERRRRNELKSSYHLLREQIPDLNTNDKTPTGVILSRACDYITSLQDLEAKLLHQLAASRAENERLRKY